MKSKTCERLTRSIKYLHYQIGEDKDGGKKNPTTPKVVHVCRLVAKLKHHANAVFDKRAEKTRVRYGLQEWLRHTQN